MNKVDSGKFQLSEFTGTERFLVERKIGAGGFGIVYQVYDRERQTTIALKTLRQGEAEALYRFKQEFRSLIDLAHANLVSLYELISHNDQWFFTMELIQGVNFVEYVRGENYTQQDVSNSIVETLRTPKQEKPDLATVEEV